MCLLDKQVSIHALLTVANGECERDFQLIQQQRQQLIYITSKNHILYFNN